MSDVIGSGSERDPWRPSRRTTWLGVLALVLLAGLAYGARALHEHQQQQAADQRLADQVALAVTPSSTGSDWQIGNLSPSLLTVTSARLDFPDRPLFAGPRQLSSYGSLDLQPGPQVCDQRLYDRGPSSLVVEAVTARGVRLTRRITLGAGARAGLWSLLRGTCQMPLPGDALVGEIVAATWTGGTVRLTYGVYNVGELPLTVEAVTYLPGVAVRAAPLPLVLPVREKGANYPPTRDLVVQLHVSSCGQLEAALRRAHGGDGLDGPVTLKPQLSVGHARGGGYLDLGDHAERLERTCPAIASLLDSWR